MNEGKYMDPDHMDPESDCSTAIFAATSTARRSKAAGRTERGALLVEFALLAPLLIMLLLGTITMGMDYNRSISLNNSAREAARYGATLPIEGDLQGWLNSIADVARDASAGDLAAGAPGQRICVAYVYPDGTETHDRTMRLVETAGARQLLAGGTCFNDGRGPDERRVQITVERDMQATTGLWSSSGDLTAQSVVRFERVS